MKAVIIQIGKTKNSFFKEAEAEYTKRLSPYARVEVITLKEFAVSSSRASDREIAKEREGAEILKNIPKDSVVIVLDEKGEIMDSVQFAKFFENQKNTGSVNLTFIIGGPFGLSEAVKKSAHKMISFSRFTFTHEMIRILLLEQIYRAQMILAGKTYHY